MDGGQCIIREPSPTLLSLSHLCVNLLSPSFPRITQLTPAGSRMAQPGIQTHGQQNASPCLGSYIPGLGEL